MFIIKDIPKYESQYAITDDGRVWSKYKQGWMNLQEHYKGYKRVPLTDRHAKKQKLWMVHRLVLMTYSQAWNPMLEVNHKDGNKTNNHIDNLEMVTAKENTAHAWKNNLTYALSGHLNGMAKLTPEQVVFIRRELTGLSSRVVSGMFNVCRSTIKAVRTDKIWRNSEYY